MSVTAYPTLRLKLTMPQALKLQFLPAIPGSNAAAAAADAQAAAAQAEAAANAAVAATANKVDRTGDVMTGFLTLNADPTASLHAATKHYVDVQGSSGIPEAPNDGALYGRQSLGWAAAQPLDADLTSLAAASATNAIYYRSATNTWATVTIGSNLTFTGGTLAATGGGGGGAPTTAEYITSSTDATLSAERVLTNTASITWDFSTPGQAKANTAAGGGNVSNSGTPTVGQYGKWVTATTIQGVAPATVLSDIGAQPAGSYQVVDATLTALAAYNTNGLLTQTATDVFTGRTLTGPAAGISVSNGNGVSGNPTLALANDLAALEGLAGTNNIYYRSGADTWSSVTIGTGLTFAAGTLAATGGGGTATPVPPQGRLTLTTGTPVMTATVSGATTIRYTPYVGNQLGLYDGTSMVMTTFTELSNITTNSSTGSAGPAAVATNSNYDLFVWSNAGTPTLTRGPAWTNDTTRSAGTALVMVNGIWLNNASITNGPAASRGTYVGTVRSNASSQIDWILPVIGSPPTAGVFNVWNAYNRVDVAATVQDNTATWTLGQTAFREFNSGTTYEIRFLMGLQEDAVRMHVQSSATAASTGDYVLIGVGIDSTTTPTGPRSNGTNQPLIFGASSTVYSSTFLGYHFIAALEATTAVQTATVYGPYNGMTAQMRM